jgi:hypothetical protein
MVFVVVMTREKMWEGENRIGTATIVERALEMVMSMMGEACLWKCVPVSLDDGGGEDGLVFRGVSDPDREA